MDILSLEYSYTLDDQLFNTIISEYNEFLPIEYIEGGVLTKCFLSEGDHSLHYNLELVGLDMATLSDLNSKNIKDYMLELFPYFTDAPHVLAVMTDRDVVYDFTADCSSWWKMSTRLKMADYQEVLE